MEMLLQQLKSNSYQLVKIRPLRYGNRSNVKISSLLFCVKIRPLRYGNNNINEFLLYALAVLKSDRYGMEINNISIYITCTFYNFVKIRPLRYGNNLYLAFLLDSVEYKPLKSDRYGMEITSLDITQLISYIVKIRPLRYGNIIFSIKLFYFIIC